MGRNNYHQQIIYPIGHIQKATRSSIMHSKSELNHVSDSQYLSTFHWGSIRWVGSESCSFLSKENSHRPPSWIASERRDWKLVSRFCFGQQSPVHRRFYSILYQRSTTSIFSFVFLFKCWSTGRKCFETKKKR